MAKIFVVDDDPLMVRMYQKKLENDGYEVETAGDGVEALEKLKNYIPNLILLDIMMPKLNGLQVLEKLKADPIKEKIPVVILTNVASLLDRLQVPTKVFELKADDRVIPQRIEKRKLGSTFSDINSLDQYLHMKNNFDPIRLVNPIQIDTSKNLEQTLAEIFSHLDELKVLS